MAGKLGSVTMALIGELFTLSMSVIRQVVYFLTSELLGCWFQLSLGTDLPKAESSVKPEVDKGTVCGEKSVALEDFEFSTRAYWFPKVSASWICTITIQIAPL